MLQERKFPTFLTKLTPAPKLWFAVGLSFSVVFIMNLYFSIAVMLIGFGMILHEKKMGLFKVVLITMTVLFISLYSIHGTMAPNINPAVDPIMFTVLGIPYYAKGFAFAAHYFFRVAPLMCALFLIILSIDTTDLGTVMCKAGIPYHFVFTFVDAFQVIVLLQKDMNQIRDAQRARGLETEGSLVQRFKAFIPIMVPVVANSIVKVQDQAVAMDTKGFGSKSKKTVYREIVPYKWDPVCKGLGIFMLVFSIAYKILTVTNVISPVLTNLI